jgi:hypothetical protein
VIGSNPMASITEAVLCAAVATLFWTGLGFAITRRLVVGTLALPIAPVVGWAVHSAIALPVLSLVPFSAGTIAAVAAIALAGGIFHWISSNRTLTSLALSSLGLHWATCW